jgi:hypothetical protein
MKQAVTLAMTGIAMLATAHVSKGANSMTENQNNLNRAHSAIKEFRAEMEPERLREAYMALENVVPSQEHDAGTREAVRKDCLYLWLRILDVIDHLLDPKFDPNDVPELTVQPPPNSDGTAYPAGADPSLIKDPQARARYEKAIEANRVKARNRRLQFGLRRLNQSVPERAESFIRNWYTTSANDQRELRLAIDEVIKNRVRRAGLLKLLTPTT